MNWLAHLRLAPTEPLVRLGNLAGDFVRGVDLATLVEPIRRGIAQHRALDRFVDAHPAVGQSRARLAPPFRRFAGVLVDVFYDHFLARDWERLGDGTALPAFTQRIYADLRAHAAVLPPRLQMAAPWMERQDWLSCYGGTAGVELTLARMGSRSPRTTLLGAGGAQLREHYDGLANDFAILWLDVTRHLGTPNGLIPGPESAQA